MGESKRHWEGQRHSSWGPHPGQLSSEGVRAWHAYSARICEERARMAENITGLSIRGLEGILLLKQTQSVYWESEAQRSPNNTSPFFPIFCLTVMLSMKIQTHNSL